MEEDIKVLEEMKQELLDDINRVEEWVNTGADEEKVRAIENLIKRNKELEDTLNDLVQVKQDVGSISYTMPSKLAKASIEVLVNSDLKMKNKKLQEKIKEQQKQLNIANKKILSQKGQLKVVNTSYIPKSKVRELIAEIEEDKETLKNQLKGRYGKTYIEILKYEILILQELLEEGNE